MFPVRHILVGFLLILLQCSSSVVLRSKWPTSRESTELRLYKLPSIERKTKSLEEDDTGKLPKLKKLTSQLGLVQGVYDSYKFNWNFNLVSKTDAETSKYVAMRDYLKPVVEEILDTDQLPSTTSTYGLRWEKLSEALETSYTLEKGAIIYDNDDFKKWWIYCGWFDIDGEIYRMCGPLSVMGLEQIERNPLPNQDYLPKPVENDQGGEPKKPKDNVTKKKEKNSKQNLMASTENSATNETSSGEQMVSLRSLMQKLRSYVNVDLFGTSDSSEEATYNSECLSNISGTLTCPPICCYSTYIGSEFCTEEPMNCIYLGGEYSN